LICLLAGGLVAASSAATPATPGQQGGTAQGQGKPAAPPPPPLPTFDTGKPAKLEIFEARARYKVQEQLVGVDFPNEAVGSTQAVKGTLIIAPDGSVTGSKIVVDMRTFESDQELRDNYIRTRVLETDKFPTLEFVPKRVVGLTPPLPSPPQAQAIGFKLVGDMTIRGVTKEVAWRVVGTLRGATVAGSATTTASFSEFNLPKPSVRLLLSVEDQIQLEVEFRATRSTL
jgi:polyisoprenoid-binding protein YceI